MEENYRESNIEEKDTQTVGQFLVDLRRAAGLTQKETADRLGISNKTISRWETDRGLPDVDLLVQVARLYGVTVDELLSGRRAQKLELSIEKETNETDEEKYQDRSETEVGRSGRPDGNCFMPRSSLIRWS